jgi:hypothetical protein
VRGAAQVCKGEGRPYRDRSMAPRIVALGRRRSLFQLVSACGAARRPSAAERENAAAQEARERLVYERGRTTFIARHLRKRRALLGHQAVKHGLGIIVIPEMAEYAER